MVTVADGVWPLQYSCAKCKQIFKVPRYDASLVKCNAWPGGTKPTYEQCFENKAAKRVIEHNKTASGYGFHVLEVVPGAYPITYRCSTCQERTT